MVGMVWQTKVMYHPVGVLVRGATMVRVFSLAAIILSGALVLCKEGELPNAGNQPQRVPWTTSRILGTPEAPPPYQSERIYTKLGFRNPVLLTAAPFSRRMVVAEQGGKIWSFPNDPACEKPDLFADLAAGLKPDNREYGGFEALYGLAFHPRFAENRYCYVCYVLRGKNGPHPQGTKVSRFRVSHENTLDLASEQLLITWLGGGHNGGDLHFGNDGMLFISTGDATDPAPPDRLATGQDISDLLGSILRIDVDREGKDSAGKALPYAIPADNPFVSTPKARGEVWAYGFRNPWRMSFDRPSGELWVGDVGWELYEMVHRVKRGGNYGWSVMEGPQLVSALAPRGPTPILPPLISFPHTEAASITGGFVYRGKLLKGLEGSYICGDWVTRKIWAIRVEGDTVTSLRELAHTGQQIIAFGQDHAGELFFLDYKENGAGIYRLVPNAQATHDPARFPRKLSETGLFESIVENKPAKGVYPFGISSPRFADHAKAERLIGLPGDKPVRMYDRAIPIPGTFFSGQVFMPKDTVLAKTYRLPVKTSGSPTEKAVETQVLHFDGSLWNAYSYAWNENGTDADLVRAEGMERELEVLVPGNSTATVKQTWRFASRTQCLTCHNPWSGQALAFNPAQLAQASSRLPKGETRELARLKALGLVEFRSADGDKPSDHLAITPLVETNSDSRTLESRARSYLHANCAHCHQPGAGGTATIDLRHTTPLGETKVTGIKPTQGSFGLPDAAVLTPGDPYRSVLYYRMAKTGSGHMPHLGAEQVDSGGLALMHDWIGQMRGDSNAKTEGTKLAMAALEKLKADGPPEGKALEVLLDGPLGGLVLAHGLDLGTGMDKGRPAILSAISTINKPEVRDVVERFLPPDQRVRRLGNQIDGKQLLAKRGDPARGKALFFQNTGPRCASCHRIDGVGSTLGPDLSGIGKKYQREQVLEHVLHPSKTIDPQYATQVVETVDGKLVSGILAKRTGTELVLRSAEDKEIRIAANAVVSMQAQSVSSMPEMLLRDLTAQQAVDLIDYLASLQKESARDQSTGGR